MKKFLLLLLFCMTVLPVSAYPAGQLKLSLWGRAALASPGNIDQVSGFDFGLLGTTTEKVDGFQFGILYARTTEKLNGLSLSLFNRDRDVDGMQLGAFSLAERDLWGVQMGAVNIAQQSMRGVQLGAFNYAWYIRGVQLGVVNYAHRLKGVQLGLINIASNGIVPAMIIVNARF